MARLVVVAPGRGSYNRSELGYLKRGVEGPRGPLRLQLLKQADQIRETAGRMSISSLDGASAYQPNQHLPGENASSLIFTGSAADYETLNPAHQVVAVLGNSMGWYSTLYTSGCLSFEHAFRVVDTMGQAQSGGIVGGQLIYPVIDDDWRTRPDWIDDAMARVAEVASQGDAHWVGLSIRLGGFLVLAGTDQGLRQLLKALPVRKLGTHEYPFQLAKHAAFHTHLMVDASRFGFAALADVDFQQPKVPMIDGRGAIWRPLQADPNELRDYTFGTQIREPFDFSAAVRVALREYNPDHVVLLGPGETLGGAIAHVMIAERWRGITSKSEFLQAQQTSDRPLIAMNRLDQAQTIL